MAIKHVFKDAGELQYFTEKGEYDIEVYASRQELTPKGDDKIALILKDSEGRQVTDDLLFTEKMAWKVDLVLKALRLTEGMEKGHECDITPEIFVGKKARVFIDEETYEKDGQKKSIMKVKRWIIPKVEAPKTEATKQDDLKY